MRRRPNWGWGLRRAVEGCGGLLRMLLSLWLLMLLRLLLLLWRVLLLWLP